MISNCQITSILTLILLVTNVKLDLSDYKNADDLVKMVSENIEASQSYQAPINNSAMLNTTSSEEVYFGTFDFIIVGAGAGGSVLANRLSEIKNWSVLLLEAGETASDFANIPELFHNLFSTKMNWGYNYTSETTPEIQRIYPRGKALGGCSAINGAVYSRGGPQDYDDWQLPGWSYDEVLPYFRKSENVNFSGYDPKYHGKGGYWNVMQEVDVPEANKILVNAFKELGHKEVTDYNGHSQLGISKLQYNHVSNERQNIARAFLSSQLVKERPNLNITVEAFVTKLLIAKDKIVSGVTFIKNGIKYIAKSKKETILSAGAVNSPQILLLSGIGPQNDLNNLGIDAICDLPVGESVIDHLIFREVYFRTSHTFFNLTYKQQAELFLQDKRPWTGPFINNVVFYKLNESKIQKRPDIEIMFEIQPPNYEDYPTQDKIHTYSTSFKHFNDIRVYIGLMRPKSRGFITISSNDPVDFPKINPGLFRDSKGEDLEAMYQALVYLEDINKTKTFQENGVSVFYPKTPECDSLYEIYSKAWYKCVLWIKSSTGYHIVGSTPMGTSKEISVVNTRLKVHEVENLRVVDAGVMPDINSGHTVAPTVMIAEKAADFIKQHYLV